MALFRKFFYKKPPEGLLEISERVYVFDYCFTTDVMEEDEYRVYIRGIITQLCNNFPDASFMVFNLREGEKESQISNILCEYNMMTVMDYPRQYEGCPLLTMETIHHFLRSGENWLQLWQQNVVLMHCELGGWPVLAFLLAALLIYRKQYTGEQKTLDMIYKQAPRELLQLMSPLNPIPSQLRYLQYISRRNVGSEWPPLDRALTLDCVIIRVIPNMDGEGGCRPIFRIYGQDPFMVADRTPKVLFSTPKRSKLVRHYKQADCELVKIDIHCHVQGDVVLECISLDSDLEHEEMVFRVMFNTAFIRSNILMLNRDEIDILWNCKDNFSKNFRVEILFSDMEASAPIISIDLPRIEAKDGLPVEAFSKVQEIFSNVDWIDSKTEVANMLQQFTASNILLERLDSGGATKSLLKESLSGRFKSEPKTLPENHINNFSSPIHGKRSMSSFESSGDAPLEKKIEPLESKVSLESNIGTRASEGQGKQPIPSFGLSTDSNSTVKEMIESLESKASLENDSKYPTPITQGKWSVPLTEPSTDAKSMKKIIGPLESKQKKLESLESEALLENDTKFPTSMFRGKQSIPFPQPSVDANSIKKKIRPLESKEEEIESFESKALLESFTKCSASIVEEKESLPFIESSAGANSMKMKIEPLESKEENESLESKALLEKHRRSKFGPNSLPENDMKNQISAVHGKLSMSSFESSGDATVEKRKELLESKASPENNIKIPAPMGQGKQHITSFVPLTDSNSTKKEIESLESRVLLENDTKFSTPMAQGKQTLPLIVPSTDPNSMEKKIVPLELKEKKEIESLESKALSEIDTKFHTTMVQGKQSIPLIEPSTDANSMRKKIGPVEPKLLSENDTESLTSAVQEKQHIHLLELPIEANSIEKKIEPKELQVALQVPTQSKIISPQLHQGFRSAPVSSCNSLQGSPVAISRYCSAPSALGITTVLQDHEPMDIKEEFTPAVTVSSPSSTLPPSDSKLPEFEEPSSVSVPSAPLPAFLPSSPLKSPVDAHASIEKTCGPLPRSSCCCSFSSSTSSSKIDAIHFVTAP